MQEASSSYVEVQERSEGGGGKLEVQEASSGYLMQAGGA